MKALNIARIVLYAVLFAFTLPTAILAGVVVANTNTERKQCHAFEPILGQLLLACADQNGDRTVGILDTAAVVLLVAAILVIITLAPL